MNYTLIANWLCFDQNQNSLRYYCLVLNMNKIFFAKGTGPHRGSVAVAAAL